MKLSSNQYRLLLLICWIGVAITTAVFIHTGSAPGWDLAVYRRALESLRAGHDPYADGIARQVAFHGTPASFDSTVMPPYTYVYSPLTLPLLHLLAPCSFVSLAVVYWLLYAIAILAIARGVCFLAEPSERRIFAFFAALLVFLPGLLQADVILSGNLAYILYALVLTAAVRGWRTGSFTLFYLAVLLASCFKAPLLTLLFIPVLSRRGEAFRTAVTAAIGLLLFALQPVFAPRLFATYLRAVNLQFVFNADFGFSPSGLLGATLYAFHRPYTTATTVFYLLYAPVVLAVLIVLSRRCLAGCFSLQRWLPVMLLGVLLLNPRIKEYDIAPLSVAMAAILWRFALRFGSSVRAASIFATVLLALNLITFAREDSWKPLEGALLIAFFVLGSLDLSRRHATSMQQALAEPSSRAHSGLPLPAV